MKRVYIALLILLSMLLISSCDSQTVQVSAPVSETNIISPSPETSQTPPPESVEPPSESVEVPDPGDILISFLDEKYDAIISSSGNAIVGIGFIDLDLDNEPELILFDSGASASLGVNIFDVVGGEVCCVSASMSSLAALTNDVYLSDVIINANYMESFRLRENAETKEHFFTVESVSGSIDASYNELISFRTANGVLTLNSECFRFDEYDFDTGGITFSEFRIGIMSATEEEYEAFLTEFDADNLDLGLECEGVFTWENSEYTESRESFLANAYKALSLYTGE
jgi:hypothetical protein